MDLTPLHLPAEIIVATNALKPFLLKIFGPPSDQIGGFLGDLIGDRRKARTLKILEKARVVLEETGTNPGKVADRVVFPLLDAASVEEDERLQDMWASMLANAAATPENAHPAYVEILRQLSPEEAQLLSILYVNIYARGNVISEKELTLLRNNVAFCDLNEVTLGNLFAPTQVDKIIYSALLEIENLTRLGLCSSVIKIAESGMKTSSEREYAVTAFGQAFMRACTKPE